MSYVPYQFMAISCMNSIGTPSVNPVLPQLSWELPMGSHRISHGTYYQWDFPSVGFSNGFLFGWSSEWISHRLEFQRDFPWAFIPTCIGTPFPWELSWDPNDILHGKLSPSRGIPINGVFQGIYFPSHENSPPLIGKYHGTNSPLDLVEGTAAHANCIRVGATESSGGGGGGG